MTEQVVSRRPSQFQTEMLQKHSTVRTADASADLLA
jgi:hypothetical protein